MLVITTNVSSCNDLSTKSLQTCRVHSCIFVCKRSLFSSLYSIGFCEGVFVNSYCVVTSKLSKLTVLRWFVAKWLKRVCSFFFKKERGVEKEKIFFVGEELFFIQNRFYRLEIEYSANLKRNCICCNDLDILPAGSVVNVNSNC